MNPAETQLLLVDDTPMNLELLSLLLSREGYQVEAVSNGEQAMNALRSRPFDLVLLDIMMPGLSGLEVCRQMQAEPKLAGIPVIFVTALNDQKTLMDAFGSGGVDYLTKPFVPKEMLARVQVHLRLHASERRLGNLLAMRELMMSTLSHDLRGPIGTMASMLDLMQNSRMPPDRFDKIIENLAASAHRAYDLLEDLLTWSRAVTQELPFHPYELPVLELVKECVLTQQEMALAKEIELELEIPAGQKISTDPNLFRPILMHLLNNALKFTPPAGKIRLKTESLRQEFQLQLSDMGPGVPDNLSAQLQRNQPIVSTLGSAGEKGTGMGLKICQEFAQRHGGRIEIQKLAQGSCFSLILPQP